jgi:ribosome-binding factor A
MTESRRSQRVARLLGREIPVLLSLLPDLPSQDLITVTGVEVSPDLRYAKIYYSVLTDQEEDWHLVAKLLARHAKELRHQLSQRVTLKYHPEIHFIADRTASHADHIETLLRQIHRDSDERTP